MTNGKTLNAKELRDLPADHILDDIKRNPMYLILDDVYDTYNIGGLFRLADALAIQKLYICGNSETPPNHRIKKASIGTYKVVPWEYKETALEAIQDLKASLPQLSVVSVELDSHSVPYTSVTYSSPVALIVGNETHGVSQEVLDLSDTIVHIPMHGYNASMNVIVSAAIVSAHVLNEIS